MVETASAGPERKGYYSTLRRITTSGKFIPEIDGLRFIAILSVVLYHVPVQIPLHGAELNGFWRLIANGQRGVQLFFVISGFILGLPFAAHHLQGEKPVSLRNYFLRRITRLEPPYIIAILIRLPLLVLVMHKPSGFVLAHGLASLLYLHSLIFGTMSAVNPPAWSLEVEIQFYCLAPLFGWSYFHIMSKWIRRTLGLIFILVCGAAQTVFASRYTDGRLSLSILEFVQYFFAGFVLCDLYLTDWKQIPEHWAWDVLSTALWCWIFGATGWVVHILLPFAILMAYLGAFKGRVYRAFFSTPWISLIGGMCYSIYLTHNLAITASAYALRPWLNAAHSDLLKALLAYVLALPLSLVVGLALYRLVERPCMDKEWPSKLVSWFQRPHHRHDG